jgi:hypothetical protein
MTALEGDSLRVRVPGIPARRVVARTVSVCDLRWQADGMWTVRREP